MKHSTNNPGMRRLPLRALVGATVAALIVASSQLAAQTLTRQATLPAGDYGVNLLDAPGMTLGSPIYRNDVLGAVDRTLGQTFTVSNWNSPSLILDKVVLKAQNAPNFSTYTNGILFSLLSYVPGVGTNVIQTELFPSADLVGISASNYVVFDINDVTLTTNGLYGFALQYGGEAGGAGGVPGSFSFFRSTNNSSIYPGGRNLESIVEVDFSGGQFPLPYPGATPAPENRDMAFGLIVASNPPSLPTPLFIQSDTPGGGLVEIARHTPGAGNVAEFKAKMLTVVDQASVTNSRLFYGDFAPDIAATAAAQRTANAFNDRLAVAPVIPGAVIISNATTLATHRAAIAAGGGTFIFTGTVDVTEPILAGSGTTLWIDGVIQWTAVAVPSDPLGWSPGVFGLLGTNGNRLTNIKLIGTKRSQILAAHSMNGIYANEVNNSTISNLTILSPVNGIKIEKAQNWKISGNFVHDGLGRGIHVKTSVGSGSNPANYLIENNLFSFNGWDGIDLDAFTAYTLNRHNLILHNGRRLMIWNEINSHHNVTEANVGIFQQDTLVYPDGRHPRGIQENGNLGEPEEPGFTYNNSYLNNDIFYANQNKTFVGFSIHPGREVDRASTVFQSNRVWVTKAGLTLSNLSAVNSALYIDDPKTNLLDDVTFRLVERTGPVGVPLAASLVNQPNGLALKWSGASGYNYNLQQTANLSGIPIWSNLWSNVAGVDAEMSVTNPVNPALEAQFFRLQKQ